MEALTSNSLITLDMDADELILNLHKIQPKLHKRATEGIKRRQLDYILNATEQLFGGQPAEPAVQPAP